jgi:hypothetical protein
LYSWLTHCCSLTYVYFVKSLVMLLLCCYFSLYHCIWLYENKDIYFRITQYMKSMIFVNVKWLILLFHPHGEQGDTVITWLTIEIFVLYMYLKRGSLKYAKIYWLYRIWDWHTILGATVLKKPIVLPVQ